MRRATILLVLLLSAAAAHGREIKLATWDLGWLTLRAAGDPALPPDLTPYAPADLDRMAAYARALNADVVAIQGVDGPDAAARVFPPAVWTVTLTDDDGVLRSGVAVRRGVAVTAHDGLRRFADVTLDLGAGSLRLLSVRLKAGCRVLQLTAPDADPACVTLREQGQAIGRWVAARTAEHVPFAVLGDFARVLDGPGDAAALLATDTPLLRATEGRGDPCWGGRAFTDHLLFGGPAAAWVVAGSLRAKVFAETALSARGHLPTHCPISVHLHIPG